MIRIIDSTLQPDVLKTFLKRTQFDYSDVNESVESILRAVKKDGDAAVKKYTKQFDSIKVKELRVTKAQIDAAFERVSDELINNLKHAAKNIEAFHQQQAPKDQVMKDTKSIKIIERVRPIDTVGLYVPGGTAAYPSTVLMNAIPAKIAGVKRIVMITPPGADGEVLDSLLVAAKVAGVDEIYKVGGAQGVAALTYGTKTIPKVDKIVGPGNIYVAMAKRMVSGHVGIDMVAGPSEIVILADETTNPQFAAADMLSQAEHDPYASAIVITPSKKIAARIKSEAIEQTNQLKRHAIIKQSLEDNGGIITTETMDEAIQLVNRIAPEHLEILTKDPNAVCNDISNAGAIFIGPYTPEPIGDYMAGPNHTLPTSGSARFSSALSARDFIKTTAITTYKKPALKEEAQAIINIAESEGLSAHANAIRLRLEEE